MLCLPTRLTLRKQTLLAFRLTLDTLPFIEPIVPMTWIRQYLIMFPLCGLAFGCSAGVDTRAQQRLDLAMKQLTAATTDKEKFYALGAAAKESFVVGKIEQAKRYADDLMGLLPKFQGNWNYGNAVHDANLVLGRVALREGHMDKAKKYLIEAGKSPGSPQMNSFGPNMSLAKDLLEKGERQAVLEYFELCRKFWKMGVDSLDEWSRQVKAGTIPNFGANLVY